MIAILASAIIGAIIGMFITAHALPAVKGIIRSWVWLYSAPAPEEEREGRRAEVESHIFEFIHSGREVSDASGDIAVGLFERWMKGLPSDIAWCAPFIPALLVDKIDSWSNNLRHYRVPNAMIAGVATLGLMNFLSNSSQHQTLGTWFIANGMVIVVTMLIWKIKHPLVRRIFYSWMGIGAAVMIGFIVWLTVDYHLYMLPMFQVYTLGFAAVVPFMQVFDKPWRTGLPGGRRLLFVMCWGLMVVTSLAGSQIILGNIMPLLSLWALMIIFMCSLVVLMSIITAVTTAALYTGVRGSAIGLRFARVAVGSVSPPIWPRPACRATSRRPWTTAWGSAWQM